MSLHTSHILNVQGPLHLATVLRRMDLKHQFSVNWRAVCLLYLCMTVTWDTVAALCVLRTGIGSVKVG